VSIEANLSPVGRSQLPHLGHHSNPPYGHPPHQTIQS
jgi:hypothetical protein